ncbi:MAG: hypothetical protein IJB94_03055 [Clostridia bacterium]|nr:hypothetical protein [Clostridia bacterium]
MSFSKLQRLRSERGRRNLLYVRRVKAVVDGTPKRVYVCSRCLRSGKVERAI